MCCIYIYTFGVPLSPVSVKSKNLLMRRFLMAFNSFLFVSTEKLCLHFNLIRDWLYMCEHALPYCTMNIPSYIYITVYLLCRITVQLSCTCIAVEVSVVQRSEFEYLLWSHRRVCVYVYVYITRFFWLVWRQVKAKIYCDDFCKDSVGFSDIPT